MGYHILQQFDEQLIADILRRDDFGECERALNDDARKRRGLRLVQSFLRRNWMWLVLSASLLTAVLALFVAIDARRRADDLEHRYSILEKTKK